MILTLPTNLATDGIFLLVQRDDFRTCQMAIVLTRHLALPERSDYPDYEVVATRCSPG